MRISWGHSSGSDHLSALPMQDSSADNLPSLSASSPITSQDSPGKLISHASPDVSKTNDNVADIPIKPIKKFTTTKSHETVARAAKREISEKVREDWTWSPTHSPIDESPNELDDTREWRERESDSEYSPPSPVVNADPYRYDSPDAVTWPVLSKKRKRWALLEEEMQWNEGLRTFYERRNAWAGARIRPLSPPPNPSLPSSQTPVVTIESNRLPAPPSPTSGTHLSMSKVLLPVASPILPIDNPIRASIQPSTYPSIYEKIIIRGLSPTIPINLKDVVHALVAGWKRDGEWPPKTEAEKAGAAHEAGARGEGKRLAKKGVGRVKRALGLGRGIDGPGRGEGVREE